jgi:hypothetical protein
MWSVFVGVANFKTRNDPGGTVKMEVTHKGETKIIEVGRDQIDGMGGVGLLGGVPDGEVETQTNRPEPETAGRTDASGGNGSLSGVTFGDSTPAGANSSGGAPGGSATGSAGLSDGGETDTDLRSPLDDAGPAGGPSGPGGPTGSTSGDRSDAAAARDGPGDTYCGNCTHFDYVRTDQGMQPYCGHHDELMDDMDACDQWTPR